MLYMVGDILKIEQPALHFPRVKMAAPSKMYLGQFKMTAKMFLKTLMNEKLTNLIQLIV